MAGHDRATRVGGELLMNAIARRLGLIVGLGIGTGVATFGGGAILPGGFANAQVIPDGTLPTNVTSPNNLNFAIDGGSRSGNNLFHSFRQFSVPTGGSAVFNNAADIQTIFSRITGGSASTIDGLIQANGNASLFLLNPHGILFGPNAALNIGGSFLSTTANSIQFSDGVEFSAANPTVAPLLTINVPVGLQMGLNPAPINVQGMGHRLAASGSPIAPYAPYAPYRGLQVRPGQTLALIGGNLDLTGAILQAPGGRLEIGSVAQPGQVTLQRINQGFSANYSNIANFGAINFTQQSSLEVGSLQSGSIQVQGGQVSLQDSSLISGTNFGPRAAGTINILATQSLTLSGALPSLNILGGIRQDNFGPGHGGNIVIQTPNLLVQSGATIFSRNYGSGPGGTVTLQSQNIQVVGYATNAPDVFSRVGTLATARGKGGNLSASTQTLSLSEGGFIGSVNFFDGIGGGDVVVNADTIDVQGISPAQISSAIGAYNLAQSGRSGDLTVNARTLRARNGGVVSTSSISAGDSGQLTVNASESIEVSGYGSRDSYQSLIASAVPRPLVIYQKLFGLPAIPSGASGNVQINTPYLNINNGGIVSVSNYGTGKAGTLDINASKIQLKDGALIGAVTFSGDGGNIDIQADQIIMVNNTRISAAALGNGNTGNGGNIKIDATAIVGVNNSDIFANASRGRGGNIDIVTQAILGLKFRPQLTPESDISASSDFGINGNVQVNIIGSDFNPGLINLPTNIVDSSQGIATDCSKQSDSRFVITGRGGVPLSPMEEMVNNHPWTDTRDLSALRAGAPTAPALAPTDSTGAPLVQATGWRRNPQTGQVELYAETSATSVPDQSTVTCAPALAQPF
jgi:filamentous hemagglutinin family protein